MKKLLSILLVFSCFALTACNTVKGAGDDIRATGDAISNAAKKAKRDI